MAALTRTRTGAILCQPHIRTGAPIYHTPGCEACDAARARGIVRPDAPADTKESKLHNNRVSGFGYGRYPRIEIKATARQFSKEEIAALNAARSK